MGYLFILDLLIHKSETIMTPSEENCKGCPFSTNWGGPYGLVDVPACDHPSLKKTALIPDELDECPKDKKDKR